MRVEKKTTPEYFEKVLVGDKTFELRLADFELAEGDTLVLREWDSEKKEYTGRRLKKEVGIVWFFDFNKLQLFNFNEQDLKEHGMYVISLK